MYPYAALVRGAATNRATIDALRTRALRRVVRHAAERVPYYAALFARAGVDPRSVRHPRDLAAVPVTTKDAMRRAGRPALLARGSDVSRLVGTSSSGSSGEPFTAWRTRSEHRAGVAFWMRAFGAYGARLGDRSASVEFIGRHDEPGPTGAKRTAARLGLYRRLRLDCRTPLDKILEAVRRHRPHVFGAYPSMLASLAALVPDGEGIGPQLRLMTTGAETLTESVRQRVERAFGAPLRNTYGSVEFSLLAWECPETDELHVCDDNVVLEVLKDGRPAETGEVGEVVATSLQS